MLIGVGSRRRSASQAIDLPSDGGVNLERLFTLVWLYFDIKRVLNAPKEFAEGVKRGLRRDIIA